MFDPFGDLGSFGVVEPVHGSHEIAGDTADAFEPDTFTHNHILILLVVHVYFLVVYSAMLAVLSRSSSCSSMERWS